MTTLALVIATLALASLSHGALRPLVASIHFCPFTSKCFTDFCASFSAERRLDVSMRTFIWLSQANASLAHTFRVKLHVPNHANYLFLFFFYFGLFHNGRN